jgi:hypothetical protein
MIYFSNHFRNSCEHNISQAMLFMERVLIFMVQVMTFLYMILAVGKPHHLEASIATECIKTHHLQASKPHSFYT